MIIIVLKIVKKNINKVKKIDKQSTVATPTLQYHNTVKEGSWSDIHISLGTSYSKLLLYIIATFSLAYNDLDIELVWCQYSIKYQVIFFLSFFLI